MFSSRIPRLVLVAAILLAVVSRHVSVCIELKRLSALSTSTTTTATTSTTTIASSPTTLISPSPSTAESSTMKQQVTSTPTPTPMVDTTTATSTTTSAPMQQILVFNEKTQIFELVPNISLNAIVVDFDPVKDLQDKSRGRVLSGGGGGSGSGEDGGGGFNSNCLNCENGMPAMNSSLCGCKSNNTVDDTNLEEMSTTSTSTPAPPTSDTRPEESPTTAQPPTTTTTMAPTVAVPKPKPARTRTWDSPKRLRNWTPSKSINSWDAGKRTRGGWDTPRRIVTKTTTTTEATPDPLETTEKPPEPRTRGKIIIGSSNNRGGGGGFNSNRDHSRPRIKASRRKLPKNSHASSQKNQNGAPQCQYVACISPCYIFRTSLDECPECSCPEFNRFDKIKFFATSSFEPSFKQDRFKNQTFN